MKMKGERAFEVEKSFYDYAEEIEGVSIHFVLSPLGSPPDWENERSTRYMPPVQDRSGKPSRMRLRLLRLPLQIETSDGQLTSHYQLHHYFEIYENGSRHHSPLFTEEIDTGA